MIGTYTAGSIKGAMRWVHWLLSTIIPLAKYVTKVATGKANKKTS